jgi:uncharacterized protein
VYRKLATAERSDDEAVCRGKLLEEPELIHSELDRRLAAARKADPTKRREEALRRDLVRIRKSIDCLLTAYQEGLLSLDELRERMPNLRRREQADNTELQPVVDQFGDGNASDVGSIVVFCLLARVSKPNDPSSFPMSVGSMASMQ